MLFNSVAFLIFLPAVVILYYLLPVRYRWVLLLAASYTFYAWWKVEYLLLIVFSTVLDFAVAQQLFKEVRRSARLFWLSISLASNLGLLVVFKYLLLFLPDKDPMMLTIYSVDYPILGTLIYGVYFAIPVGISFYTFQTMSYTLDVYHGRTTPESHLGKFAVFVSFFPQLVAGPIERFSHLQPQLRGHFTPNYRRMSRAFKLILWGFFLKICIADNLGPIVDQVYGNPLDYNLVSRWLGTLAFGFQIYADFAGYTLIAQGAALLLGIELMDNFRTPYLSMSISEFWKRWHISLSTWFRDYLYLPLGGNRVSAGRWIFNILLVFCLSGFWHGANWTFLIWGAIHGLLYLLERFVWGKPREESSWFRKIFAGLRTFVMVNIAWVFFRGDSVNSVLNHFETLFSASGSNIIEIPWSLIVIITCFLISEVLLYNGRIDNKLEHIPLVTRWMIYAFLLYAITAWGGIANHPFIYFQF